MNNILLSIIIPTKNSQKTIESCLLSVKNQTYKNIEIIVVDNNSEDNTKEIVKKYTDKVFNLGPERSTQRNFGVKKSDGYYVLIIDSDMVLSKNVAEECIEKISTDENIKGLIIPEESFGKGIWAKSKKLERSFYVGVDWIEAARFFKKDAFLELGGYNENLISGEDWDLSQRIEQIGKVDRINSFIFHNEGRLSLFGIIKKKVYYAKQFINYVDENFYNKKARKQISIFERYNLFFSNYKKLLENPFLSFCMLFMKTNELFFGGLSYIYYKYFKNKNVLNNYEILKIEYYPSVSFIIPTLNAEKYIRNCLQSILKQDYPKDKIEIIIVDAGSTDETIKIVNKYKIKVLFNQKVIAEYGKSIGIKESNGDYFVLFDSDNVIEETDWLKNMIIPIQLNKNIFGVESELSVNSDLSSLNRMFARMRIADPLARILATKPRKRGFNGYQILEYKNNSILITGANGFLWDKKIVMQMHGWEDKFEEANFSTKVHELTKKNYAISNFAHTRHYYCNNLWGYAMKRKKIAIKMRKRISNDEYIWINKNNKLLIVLAIIYLGSFLGPAIETVYRCVKDKTFDWLWYPFVSLTTIIVYTYTFIFYKKDYFKSEI